MVSDMAPSGKGVRYGELGGGGVTAMVVEVLLEVGGFDVDRGAEMTMFNMDIDIQRSGMGGGSVPGEVDGILTVELFRKSVRESGPWGQSRNMSSINLNHRLGLSNWEPRNFCSRWPMNRLA